METKEFKIELPRETMEIGEALASMVDSTALALADGWQPGADIPAILLSSITKLGSALVGIDQTPTEFRENPVKASMAVALPIAQSLESVFKVLKK